VLGFLNVIKQSGLDQAELKSGELARKDLKNLSRRRWRENNGVYSMNDTVCTKLST
jgi:hypothetical protein